MKHALGGTFALHCQCSKWHQQPVIHTTVLLSCCNIIISILKFSIKASICFFKPCKYSCSLFIGELTECACWLWLCCPIDHDGSCRKWTWLTEWGFEAFVLARGWIFLFFSVKFLWLISEVAKLKHFWLCSGPSGSVALARNHQWLTRNLGQTGKESC